MSVRAWVARVRVCARACVCYYVMPTLITEHTYITMFAGSGSFGEIYIAVSRNDGTEVAVKLESQKTKHPQLMYESKVKIPPNTFSQYTMYTV